MVFVNARFLTQKLTGVQRFAYELSIRLKENLGNEVIFLAPRNVIQHEMADKLGVKFIGHFTGYLWEQIELPMYLYRCNKPLLFNFCSVAPLFYSNSIVTVHDITWIRFPATFSRIFQFVYNFMVPRLCKKAKRIITVSNFSKKEISSFFEISEDKFTVIYNAVGKDFLPLKDEELSRENYFLAVSSVKENKNFISVLKAFQRVREIKPSIKLFIVGDICGKNFRSIDIEPYKNLTYIKFLGRVSDRELIRYYSNAIGFVFPSLYEGFGIPVLEAQACRCPVLSSNAASLPEVLQDSALFFSPNDIIELGNLMIKIVDDVNLRNDLVSKGNNNIKRFSWDKEADVVIKIARMYN